MTFSRPHLFILIWLLPLLFAVMLYGMRRRRRILEGFALPARWPVLTPESDSRRRWIKHLLILTASACIVLALTGPQYGYRWQELRRKGVDLIIALDCSKSMLATDIPPTRLDRAKREIFDLLGLLKGDRAGLVAFAGTAFLQCPLTLDYSAFHLFLNTLTPDYLPVGGTNLGAAIRTAVSAFEPKSHTEKAVILITDGEEAGTESALEAADAAGKQGIRIFCIGVGATEGVPIPDGSGGFRKDGRGNIVLTRLDESTLKQVAGATGGAYARSVAGDMDLDVIYTQEILEKMDREDLAGGRKQVREDRYQWFLAIAVLALLAEAFLSSRRKSAATLALLCLLLPAAASEAGALREGIEAYQNRAFDAAVNHFTDAQLDDPENPKILYNLGNAHYRLGDYGSALNAYRQALETPDTRLKQKLHYNMGNAHFRQQQFKEAVAEYEKAVELAPDDQEARENLEMAKKLLETAQQQERNRQPPSDDAEKQQGQDQDQPQQESAQRNQEDQGDQGDQSGQQDQSSGQENQRRQETQAGGQQPDNTPEQKAAANRQNSTAGDQSPPKDPAGTDEQKAAGAEQQEGAPPPGSEQNAAATRRMMENILNRLEDAPGRAMMPSYGEQQVEKDW